MEEKVQPDNNEINDDSLESNLKEDVSDKITEEAKTEEGEIEQSTEKAEDDIDELKKKLDEKEKEALEYLQMAQRIKAEFENYKKRTDKEKSELIEYGKEKIILEILPVIDNFERAINSEGDLESLKEGIELIYRQFKTILDKCGVKEIEAEGLIFDPYKHHAVMQAEEEGRKENEIIEVFQKGYTLNNKVIRPSMVKVAK